MRFSKSTYSQNMKKSYSKYICDLIKSVEIAKPIYSSDISKKIAEHFTIPIDKASAATATTLKRILDSKLIDDLRFYQKGIYYRTKITPFGEIPIDKDNLIIDKYLKNDNGYETDLSLLHKWGFTTQIPNNRIIATNNIIRNTRKNKALNITLRSPKITINKDNKRYLQVLDILNILDKAPIDIRDPHKKIAGIITMFNLSYKELLYFASEYYNDNVIKQLTKVIKAEREIE